MTVIEGDPNGAHQPGIDMEKLIKLMEEMAAAPREEMGKRQPGERGLYEKYSRISKTGYS